MSSSPLSGPIDVVPPQVVDVPPSAAQILPVLTVVEDTFCMMVVEFGGNVAAAYREAFARVPGYKPKLAGAMGMELISRPEIAKRVKDLHESATEQVMLSVGSHLHQIAEIRDLAMKLQDPKTALAAEVKRGELVGFYAKPEDKKDGKQASSVTINIGATAGSVADWAAQHGKPPVIIDV